MTYLIKTLFIISLAFLSLNSCNNESSRKQIEESFQCPMKCEGEKTYPTSKKCTICNMDLKPVNLSNEITVANDQILEESIFNLTSKWTTQNNQQIELKDLKGDVLVMVMIYTSCKAACPRLVADMRNINKKVNNESVKYILVSIDPEIDTPTKLKEFAIENEMDNNQWTFLQGTIDDVREFSNVLSVKYKQISPIDFSHSNIISVFDKNGVLYHQQEGLGVDNQSTVSKIIELAQ